MKLIGQALIQGLLLPIRMYFHPLAVLSEAVTRSSFASDGAGLRLLAAVASYWHRHWAVYLWPPA